MLKRPNPLVKLYCGSCWRDDLHYRLRIHPIARKAVDICTLGLAKTVWPHRCVTCGALRSGINLRDHRKRPRRPGC